MAALQGSAAIAAIKDIVGKPVCVEIDDGVEIELRSPKLSEVEDINRQIATVGTKDSEAMQSVVTLKSIITKSISLCVDDLDDDLAFALHNRLPEDKAEDLGYEALCLCGFRDFAENAMRVLKAFRGKDDDTPVAKAEDDIPKPTDTSSQGQ